MPPLHLPGVTPSLSRLALGTMLYGSKISRDDSFELMDAFVAGGGTVLDTANGYAGWLPDGAGRSETTIGEWVRETGLRNQVVIATKGGQPRHPDPTVRAFPEIFTADLHQSLDRLKFDSVDLYWFHRDNPNLPVNELMSWAWDQIDAGLIRTIGASNWTCERIAAANALADAQDRPRLVASQVGWSLLESRAEGIADPSLVHMDRSEFEAYVESPLPVFAYQAQARGYFNPTKRDHEGLRRRYDTPDNLRRLNHVDAIAKRRGVTANQIALAWFWQQPFPSIPVIGARTLEQLRDSLASLRINLEPGEWRDLS